MKQNYKVALEAFANFLASQPFLSNAINLIIADQEYNEVIVNYYKESNTTKYITLNMMFPSLSVRGNFNYYSAACDVDETKVQHIIKNLQLESILKKKRGIPANLKARISFALAILDNPDNLFLDQFASTIDEILERKLKEYSVDKTIIITGIPGRQFHLDFDRLIILAPTGAGVFSKKEVELELAKYLRVKFAYSFRALPLLNKSGIKVFRDGSFSIVEKDKFDVIEKILKENNLEILEREEIAYSGNYFYYLNRFFSIRR